MFQLNKNIIVDMGLGQTKTLINPKADIIFVTWNKETDFLIVAIKFSDDDFKNKHQKLYSWKSDVSAPSEQLVAQKLLEQEDFEAATLL